MDWGMMPVFWRVGTVVFPADTSFNPVRYIAEIKARKIEYLQIVPAVINPIYQAWDGVPITEPRSIISTSAPTPPALRQKLAEMFPESDIMIAAGLSESINMAAPEPGEALTYPESVGEPHIDTRLRILDDDDRPVPRNQQGHIVLRGFNTALRYNNNDEVSALTWRPIKGDAEGLHWCFTGDIGVMDDDGRVSIVDRSKDVIITGGETVPSVEVEAVYMEHPKITECAAVGLEDEKWGEAILLIAAKNDPAISDADLAAELYAFGREHLAGYKVPKQIAFLDVLPRSHFGKILKRDLRDQVYDRVF
jgi:fatty-acyl-CoA synthase